MTIDQELSLCLRASNVLLFTFYLLILHFVKSSNLYFHDDKQQRYRMAWICFEVISRTDYP
jgi:hypothetical protein